MTSKNRKNRRKTTAKASRKTKKPQRRRKAPRRPAPRRTGPRKAPAAQPVIPETTNVADKLAGEEAGIRISVDGIGGETVIGDLIVIFPRTREVLQKHGLRLDVEQAGDIYMTLNAFAAFQGIKTENLIQELKEASKQPPPQQIPQLVASPTP